LTPEELLQEILFQLGAVETDIPKTTLELGRRIGELLFKNTENRKDTLVVIDEAQLIQSELVFEELRLLLNFQLNDRFMVTLLMLGQPELRERIMAIPQLEQRFYIKYHLHTFDFDNTRSYIFHRLKVAGVSNPIFTEDAIDIIYRHSFGTPRRINNICDISLLEGSKKKLERIDSDLIRTVV
jgi:general secretion pathway protein A